ncbi:hypothetical protein pVa21_078 [Vibrio phage pVa-21]|nr:hypothetical protein pVa21_078 [Vibrio phage pVa-21]
MEREVMRLYLGIERKPENSTMLHVHVAKKRTSGPKVKIVNGHAIVIREQGANNESSN